MSIEYVSVLVLNDDDEVLLADHYSDLFGGCLAPPTGIKEPREEPEGAAYRVLAGETGLFNCELTFIGGFQFRYAFVQCFVGRSSDSFWGVATEHRGLWSWYEQNDPVMLHNPVATMLDMLHYAEGENP